MSESKVRCTKCQFVKGIIFVVFLVFAVSSGYHYFKTPKPVSDVPTQIATVLPNPRLVHPFQLKDDSNQSFSDANLKDHWSILFFGFSSCPMMCPATMAELSKVYKLLQTQGAKTLPQVIMVSIDPERDTVAAMHRYVKEFDPHFIGLTGENKEIKRLTQELGIVYLQAEKSGDNKTGNIDHSGTLILVNPKGEALAFFSFPHDAKKIADDYRSITEFAA